MKKLWFSVVIISSGIYAMESGELAFTKDGNTLVALYHKTLSLAGKSIPSTQVVTYDISPGAHEYIQTSNSYDGTYSHLKLTEEKMALFNIQENHFAKILPNRELIPYEPLITGGDITAITHTEPGWCAYALRATDAQGENKEVSTITFCDSKTGKRKTTIQFPEPVKQLVYDYDTKALLVRTPTVLKALTSFLAVPNKCAVCTPFTTTFAHHTGYSFIGSSKGYYSVWHNATQVYAARCALDPISHIISAGEGQAIMTAHNKLFFYDERVNRARCLKTYAVPILAVAYASNTQRAAVLTADGVQIY